ncbi:zinc finger protein 367 [Ixodes scapularis]
MTNLPPMSKPRRSTMSEQGPSSPPIGDQEMFPWNWHENARTIDMSPGGPSRSPDLDGPKTPQGAGDAMRRGRPRLDTITSLILEGSSSPSSIKCDICNRVFPREKSLQAHLRTHTGEKPYICDYPDCSRAFAQSGQLKTHQRLHTGEKPFICTEKGCPHRFTHANRHCPEHPYALLQRDNSPTSQLEGADSENKSEAVLLWLKNYEREKSDRGSSKVRQRKLKRQLDDQAEKDAPQLLNKKAACGDIKERMLGALALMELSSNAHKQCGDVIQIDDDSAAEIDDCPLDLSKSSRYCS